MCVTTTKAVTPNPTKFMIHEGEMEINVMVLSRQCRQYKDRKLVPVLFIHKNLGEIHSTFATCEENQCMGQGKMERKPPVTTYIQYKRSIMESKIYVLVQTRLLK